MTQKSILSRPSAEDLAHARALLTVESPVPAAQVKKLKKAFAKAVKGARSEWVKKFVPTPLPAGQTPDGQPAYRPFYVAGEARYLEAYVPTHPAADARSGWVFVHRIVAENMTGGYLTKGESVRFLDGNGFNYSERNLYVVGGGVVSDEEQE